MNFKAEHLTRQLDLIPVETLGQKITIIGAGAIGSWTALALAKMGFSNITVQDFDKVDIVNMNAQFYGVADVNCSKVSALYGRIQRMTDVQIAHSKECYDGGLLDGIVISAVDSMAVRGQIFESQMRNPNCRMIIDPRMGAEQALLYVMNPNSKHDQEAYSKTLYSDQDAVQERCTAKATAYTALMLSGLVCKAVKDIVTGGSYPRTVQWNIAEHAFQAWSAKA